MYIKSPLRTKKQTGVDRTGKSHHIVENKNQAFLKKAMSTDLTRAGVGFYFRNAANKIPVFPY